MSLFTLIQITGGPSCEELFKSLESKVGDRKSVTFDIEFNGKKVKIEGLINGMEWEDASGESWNIKGLALNVFKEDYPNGRRFTAHFNTKSSLGEFAF